MDKKTIAIIVLVVIIMIGISIIGNEYYKNVELQEQQEIYNTGVNQCVLGIVGAVVNDGYVQLTVPTIDGNNVTGEATIILIQYIEPSNNPVVNNNVSVVQE